MAYSDFTLDSASRLLGVSLNSAALFPDTAAIAPAWLGEMLARGAQGGQLSMVSEKSRSEFVVAPILLAARDLTENRFSIFSGQRLDVDPARGLTGECDFILSAPEPVLLVRAPIAVIVEAKKHDIEAGLGQCVAQMVAADQFNHLAERPGHPVFGCVTTGESWQFLKLTGPKVLIDHRRYYLDNLGAILGAFRSLVAEGSGKP